MAGQSNWPSLKHVSRGRRLDYLAAWTVGLNQCRDSNLFAQHGRWLTRQQRFSLSILANLVFVFNRFIISNINLFICLLRTSLAGAMQKENLSSIGLDIGTDVAPFVGR